MYPKFIFKDIDDSSTEPSENNKKTLLRIRQPELKHEGVQLFPGTEHILLPSFTMLVLGKPGSGKSHLVNEILEQESFFKGKFDRIIYIGPTKYKDVIHDSFNTSITLDMDFIDRKIKECQLWAENMLIVMDDVVSQIPTTVRSRLQELFFNRRHELQKGTISIIITSQKLTTTPTWVRSTVNAIFCFAISKTEIQTLMNEIPLIINAEIIKEKFSALAKHEFIYINLEKGRAFDYNFIEI